MMFISMYGPRGKWECRNPNLMACDNLCERHSCFALWDGVLRYWNIYIYQKHYVDCYIYATLYINYIVTTDQKPIIDTQKT